MDKISVCSRESAEQFRRLRSLGAAASSAREPDPADPREGLVGPVHTDAAGRGRRRKKSLWCLPSLVQARDINSVMVSAYATYQISS